MGLFDYSKYIMDQKLLSIGNTYIIRDSEGNELGKIEKKLLSIGPKYIFYDHSGAEAGRIEGKIMALRPTYSILDLNGSLIATLRKKLLTFDALAQIIKRWISIRDSYGIEIIGKVDRYLILAAAVMNRCH